MRHKYISSRINDLKDLNILKGKIDSLFEQAILGSITLFYGKFIFEGKRSDAVIDHVLGFSFRQHRKRTMAAYDILDEMYFKNMYLLLGAVLESSYCLLQQYAAKEDLSINSILKTDVLNKKNYNRFVYEEIKKISNGRLRFLRLAQCVQLISNILKHNDGLIKDYKSGKMIIDLLKNNKSAKVVAGVDITEVRGVITINGVSINYIPLVISRLYIFIIDLMVEAFGFKEARLKSTKHEKILGNIINYDIREEFKTYLKSIKDGSVLFIDK